MVIYLNRRMPLEGGLYQWAKVGFGEFVGFMVAWNLWVFAIVIIADVRRHGRPRTSSYLIGATRPAHRERRVVHADRESLAVVALTRRRRHARPAASASGCRASAARRSSSPTSRSIVVPFVALARGTLPRYHPFASRLPTLSLLSLNIFGKMALGAMSGFEYVAILAGESQEPERGRSAASVVIATPLIALMFILGTSSVLALVPRDQIDLVSPIPQTLTIGLRGLGVARCIAPVLILLLLLRQIGKC